MSLERIVHVVDDDADVRSSLGELLLSAGFTPVLYSTPLALLHTASRVTEGCFLLDERLIGALEAALKQARSVSRQQNLVAEASRRVAALTHREREVLDALVAGRGNKAIADDLGISVRTVEVHRARMLRRLGAPRLADAIRLAVMATLTSSDQP